MDSLNTLRAILVVAAAFAALLLAINGRWVPALVLLVGIVAHGLLWVYLYRTGALGKSRTDDREPEPRS